MGSVVTCRSTETALSSGANFEPEMVTVVFPAVGLAALLLGALCLELLLRLLQSGLPPLAGPQVLGQLIATRIPVELILGRVYL